MEMQDGLSSAGYEGELAPDQPELVTDEQKKPPAPKKMVDEEKEKKLMVFLRNGDDLATAGLKWLMRAHRKPLQTWFSIVYEDRVSMEELHDMMQEFYWWLWDTRGKEIKSSPTGYLFRQVSHGCMRYIRDERNAERNSHHFYEKFSALTMYIDNLPYYCTQIDEKWTNIEEERLRAHDVGLVINAMGERTRIAFLHQIASPALSIKESAQIMGITDNTVRVLRARAKDQLERGLSLNMGTLQDTSTETSGAEPAGKPANRKRGRPRKYDR